MAGILSGLARFGLGKLENMELYEAPKKEDGGQEGKPAPAVVQEQDFLFDKSCTCPICDKEFKNRTVKVGKAKLSGSDLDLRPRYEQIDLLKYDIIMCPYCGYAALSRFFKFVTSPQAKNIKKTISATFEPQKETKEVYTYDEALERYKLALANAIVKQTKASEKAYICLNILTRICRIMRNRRNSARKKRRNFCTTRWTVSWLPDSRRASPCAAWMNPLSIT